MRRSLWPRLDISVLTVIEVSFTKKLWNCTMMQCIKEQLKQKVQIDILLPKKKREDRIQCPYTNCHMTCRHAKLLETHITAAHTEINKSKTCPHCGKTLGVSSLHAHIKHVHTGELRLCSKCPFSTKNMSTLKNHFRVKHTSWKQSCQFCGKIVKDVKTHWRATMCGKDVDDRKVLPCPKCHVILRTNSQLKQHTKYIHEGVKDKHCLQCSYTTYSSHNLKLHVSKVHDKTPMFKNCPHCHIRSGNMNKHLAIYHIEQTQIEA